MLRLTLAQMRQSIGRLTAGGVAIAIGTAFVAATLLAGGVITRTGYDSLTASLAQADLVAEYVDTEMLEEITALPEVAAAQPTTVVGVELQRGPTQIWVGVTPRATDPRLEVQTLVEGVLPDDAGEIALPGPMAERLKVAIGDEIEAPYSVWSDVSPTADPAAGTDADAATDTGASEGVWESSTMTLRVVGLLDDPLGAYTGQGGAGVVTPADAERLYGGTPLVDGYTNVLLAVTPGADVIAAQQRISQAADTAVYTKDEAAQELIATFGADGQIFTKLVLGFAAVALIVAALVISNTFQVLVAQRTRTLALLRCVGAGKRQLRASVLIEATILGVVASVTGIVGGTVLAQSALMVLRRVAVDAPLPATVSVTPSVILAPLLVGTLMTVLAALMPARAATRVPPIAALRPADAPVVTSRSSRVRVVLAALLTVGGVLGLVGGVVMGASDPTIGLLLGVAGGAASFVGVLVGAVFWVPKVVSGTGRLLARTGPSAKLAAANTVRNPRRTAATSTALLIGVTLVAMMSTGAASARTTLNTALDSQYPVDVLIAVPDRADGTTAVLPPAVELGVRQVDGVETMVPVRSVSASVGPAGTSSAENGGWIGLRAIEASDAAQVMRSSPSANELRDGVVVMPPNVAARFDVVDGDTVPVEQANHTGDDSWSAPTAQLTVVVADFGGSGILVTPATYSQIVPEGASANELWVRLASVDDAASAFVGIQDALQDHSVSIQGAAAERAQFQQVIDTLLAVVVGLLGVAVVIAVVGVANTLSLSVLERRRESATLRAIGLSRRQLRLTLAIEGLLIAGVGAVLGAVLGMLYGWAGSATVLSTVADVTLVVPWRDMSLVVLVALVAGLLASVLPGRSAARTSPVAALAVD
ncbi:FtsX-like permease family protein [Cellulomonas cellasea]|uniref:ABC transporter permease n=1 Tax=Cellulomonas cellasea TaxID=43670 RepID=UPI0025A3D931|nr:ABC transporter permease [Cellulomonas cellasea]MDM8084658.1 FtsX-like permease family protein [Cellulomonas cellasea]